MFRFLYIARLMTMLGLGLLTGGNAIAESAAIERPSTYAEEYAAIVEVLSKYNEGGKQAKSSIMKPAFNEKATIFGVEDGRLVGGPIQNLYNVIDSEEFRASPEARAAIVSVDIVGDAASARVDTDNISGYRFTDFFQLLKVEGKWSILSKIYYSHPSPDK